MTNVLQVATALQAAFQASDMLLARNLSGLAEQDAAREPAAGVNNVVWVVGHLAYWRHELANLAALDGAVDTSQLAVFRGQVRSRPPSTGSWSLAAAVDLSGTALRRINAVFEAASRDEHDLATFMARASRTIAHDAYHVGQVAILRRLLGYEGAV